MGVFSKMKSLVFDKDPLGIIEKGSELARAPEQRRRESSPAWKAGVAAAERSKGVSGSTSGPAKWVISRAGGKSTMTAPPVPKPASTPPRAPVVKPTSRNTFSSAKATSKPKGKIPSYNSIPSFAKNYIRVPQRTFIRDLSDSNLNRVFGPATTGTPKAKDSLPMVNLPTIAKTEPKPSVINSPQPEIKAQSAKTGSTFGTPAAIATGVAIGVAGGAALAYANRDPRSRYGRRNPTERRTTNVPHPFGETVGAASEQRTGTRRALGQRRDDENALTLTKANRIRRGEIDPPKTDLSKPNYTEFREKNAAAEVERRKVNAGGTKRSEDRLPRPSKPRIKLRRAGTPAPVRDTLVPDLRGGYDLKLTGGIEDKPKPTTTPKSTSGHLRKLTGNFKGRDTATAAIDALPDKPKPRLRKVGTTKAAPAPAAPVATMSPVKREIAQAELVGEYQKAAELRAGAKVSTPEDKVKTNEARIAEIEKQLAARKTSGKTAGLPGSGPKGSVDALAIARAEAVKVNPPGPASPPKGPATEATSEKKGFTYRGKPWPKNKGASSVRETPPPRVKRETSDPTGKTQTLEPSIDQTRRRARRRDRMARAETTVGTSQSLTQGVKALENRDRQKAIDDFVKNKGVTKLPPAGRDVMEPERAPVQTGPAKEYGYHSGRLKKSAPVLGTPASPPIASRDELLAQIEKLGKENQAAGGKGAKISTTGGIEAKAPPRVTIKGPSKAAQAKAAMEAKPPEVVKRTVLRKAGTPATGTTPQAAPTQAAPTQAAPKVSGGKLRKAGTNKLGIAALAGIGAGAFMSGNEAKADTGSYTAAAKAAGASLYESGRELAKFAVGAKIATKLPGATGAVARWGLGKALPVVNVGLTAYSVYEAAQAGMGAFRAKREAEKERAGSQAKYGSVAAATATRHARERAKGLRK